MLVLRCTTKAFKKVGSVPRYVEVDKTQATFGEWCVNTVDFINGGDLLLACVHVESLYVLFVPIQPGVSVKRLVEGLRSRLLTRLIELETPPETAYRILATYQDTAVLTKTNDRKMLGYMNSILQDMDHLLDAPRLQLCVNNKIREPRIEHHLNNIPRGISGRSSGGDAIWPLTNFWQCVRKLSPELPPRVPISLMPIHDSDTLSRIDNILYDNLPASLAGKLYTSFQSADVLYAANELQDIAEALDSSPAMRKGLAVNNVDFFHRQVQVRLERLLKGQT
ncbi:MAG: hypothetical protein DRP83_09235 [Planctomycetota bacterium]|nr:MAG: hypothetical protein DRP83_09235 [Planctomycetota bacterium]